MANILYKTIHDSVNSFYINGQIYYDQITGLYLWPHRNGKYYISSQLGVTLERSVTGSGTFYDTYYAMQDYSTSFWDRGSSISAPYIWRRNSSKYVISDLPGYKIGDADNWWEQDNTVSIGPADTYSPKGGASGNVTISENQINGWENTTLLGKYTAVGTESGFKYVGQKKFLDGDLVEYLQSAQKDGSYFTYGDIHHDGTGWIIGTRSTEDNKGYYTGTEPDVDSPVVYTRVWTGPLPDPSPGNKTITFDSYVANVDKLDFKIFEVVTLL